jgi:hypothetical protein
MSTILVLFPPFRDEVVLEVVKALKENRFKFVPQVLFVINKGDFKNKSLIDRTNFKSSFSRVSYVEKSANDKEALIFEKILGDSKNSLIDHLIWIKSSGHVSVDEVINTFESFVNSKKDAIFYSERSSSSESIIRNFVTFYNSSSKIIIFKISLLGQIKVRRSPVLELYHYFFFNCRYRPDLIDTGERGEAGFKFSDFISMLNVFFFLGLKKICSFIPEVVRDEQDNTEGLETTELETYRSEAEKKGFYCDLPSKLLSISNEGIISSCCMSLYDNDSRFLPPIDNSQSLLTNWEKSIGHQMKKEFYKGKIPDACLICLKSEVDSDSSYRLTSIFSSESPSKVKNDSFPDYEFVELKLGNNCNLACRMCNPISTSRLIDEFRAYYRDKTYANEIENNNWYKDPLFWNQLLARGSQLRKINFAGGEPLITSEAWEFLEKLVEQGDSKDIEISYNTNLTIIPKAAYETWPSFKAIRLFVSIDGHGEMYEYIRYPGKWVTTFAKIKEVSLQLENLNVEQVKFAYTVSAYNLRHLRSFLDFLESEIPKNLSPYPDIQLVENPDFLDLRVLPLEERMAIGDLLAEKLLMLMDIENDDFIKDRFSLIKSIKMLINKCRNKNLASSDWNEFDKFTKFFDKRRSQDVLNVYPELKKYL